MFPRKSSIGTVVIEFLKQRAEVEDWATRNISARTHQRRGYVTLPNQFGESNIVHRLTAALGWRHQLSHHAVSVGNQDRLAARDKADVFTQSVLENFQADGSHTNNGSFWKLPRQYTGGP
jgi:hypothetical protein